LKHPRRPQDAAFADTESDRSRLSKRHIEKARSSALP
jgi:hypothetical protein